MKKKLSPKSTPTTVWIIVLTLPFFLMLAFLVWRVRDHRSNRESTAAEWIEEHARVNRVLDALRKTGATAEDSASGVIRVTLPTRTALEMTPIQAKEIALMTRQKSGKVVKVLTPAGQVLAEAP